MALLNLITGVIIDKVFAVKQQTETETEMAYHDPAEEFKELKNVFEKIQHDGKVDLESHHSSQRSAISFDIA